MDLKNALKKLGIEVDDSHLKNIQEWRQWYEANHIENFEQAVLVRQTNDQKSAVVEHGITRKRRQKVSYKAHIEACKKWGALFFNEQTHIEAPENIGVSEVEYLEDYYGKSGLWPMLEQCLCETFGIGTVGIVTEYSANYGIMHNKYSADAIFPISCRGGATKEAAFVSEKEKDNKKYTIVNIHREILKKEKLVDGKSRPVEIPAGVAGYAIENIVMDENGARQNGQELFGLVERYTTPVRMFSILKPYNRLISDFNNAFGIPIYYDSIDMVREIDEIYDIKKVDINTSRRVIFTAKEMMIFDEGGNAVWPQHLAGVIVPLAAMQGQGGKDEAPGITEFSPTPHLEIYDTALQAALDRFSAAVGLGNESFKRQKGGIATATQIISEGQEKFANLKKHNGLMAPEFEALNRAILSLANLYERKTFDLALQIGYFLQDSVIVDDETRKQGALQEVGTGVRSIESYVKEMRGLSGPELKKEMERIKGDGGGDVQAEIDKILAEMNARSGADNLPDDAKPEDQPADA